MKNISIFLLSLLIIQSSISQPIVVRASNSNTVLDTRSGAVLNFYVPRYLDTVAANNNKGIDTAGALIKTYNPDAIWFRANFPIKHWVNLLVATTGGTPGPEGPQGIQGIQGPKGDKGDKGDNYEFTRAQLEPVLAEIGVTAVKVPKWDEAYVKQITGMWVGGTTNKSITLLLRNGESYTANFTDLTGENYTETDSVFLAHVASSITSTNISNWNTAFGWGNHAGLYQPLEDQRLGTGYNVSFLSVLSNSLHLNKPYATAGTIDRFAVGVAGNGVMEWVDLNRVKAAINPTLDQVLAKGSTSDKNITLTGSGSLNAWEILLGANIRTPSIQVPYENNSALNTFLRNRFLTASRTNDWPDANGTFAMSVNNEPADYAGNIKLARFSYETQFHTTGNAVTINIGVNRLIVNPVDPINVLTITLPFANTDGQEVKIAFGGTLQNSYAAYEVMLEAHPSNLLPTGAYITTGPAGAIYTFHYIASTNSWYRE